MMSDECGMMNEKARGSVHSSLRTLHCFSSCPEELLHERAALPLEHAPRQGHPVVQRIRVADAEDRLHRARLLVPRAVDEPPDPGLDERARAHRARLDGRV